MRKVGDLLKKEREAKGLTVEEVSKATKLKAEYIRQIEKSNYDIGVSGIYLKGFIKRYANYLEVDNKTVEALYRRETGQEVNEIDVSVNKPMLASRFILSPKVFYIIGSLIIFIAFLTFLGYQFVFLLSSPSLSIYSPVNIEIDKKLGNQEISEEVTAEGARVVVEGMAQDGSLVYINNTQVVLGEDNEFKQDVAISEGTNEVTVKAENGFDKQTIIKINVIK